uniref:Uncharacterized protein n=1 Tax=Rhizophora mucronata TaxID=61149 RepID=A0A2P2N3T9_RHIMU
MIGACLYLFSVPKTRPFSVQIKGKFLKKLEVAMVLQNFKRFFIENLMAQLFSIN